MSYHTVTHFIAGLQVHVHSRQPVSDASSPVAILFMLHGRLSKSRSLSGYIATIFDTITPQSQGAQTTQQDLLAVTFDHRNHGSRLVDKLANQGWDSNPDNHNPNHAIDMYAIQTGTAADVSFLIDFLPPYLFPSAERTITNWGVLGISLGGHSTWIAMKNEPRLSLGIPIIGCPDYLTLIKQRAENSSIPLGPPAFPGSLHELIKKTDPASTPFSATSTLNPYLHKRILVLSGGSDPLVPWSASKQFVDSLEVGDGVKKVVVEPGAEHEVTSGMIEEASLFIQEWLARVDTNDSRL